MLFDFEYTDCCAIGMITNEDIIHATNIADAVKSLRNRLYKQRFQRNDFGDIANEGFTTVIATASTHDEVKYDLLNELYKKAGFKSMGPAMLNPNSGNKVKKWYINIGLRFKP